MIWMSLSFRLQIGLRLRPPEREFMLEMNNAWSFINFEVSSNPERERERGGGAGKADGEKRWNRDEASNQ